MQGEFNGQLIALLPRLRVHALALTRNGAAADDLVQDTVRNALAGRDGFEPGTNLAAWTHRILKNSFISTLRRQRETGQLDDTPESVLAVRAGHEDRSLLTELDHALARLPDDQREALVMVALRDMSYEELAAATNCAVGTAKSRVHRARLQLRAWLVGDVTRLSEPHVRAASDPASARPAA